MRPPLLPRVASAASATPPRRQRTVRPPMPSSPALLSSTPPPAAVVESPKPETTQQHPPPARRRLTLADEEWHPLPLSLAELSLPLTLPTGQTFLWRRTSLSPLRFTAAVGPHLVSLSHLPDDDRLAFLLHNDDPSSPSSSVAAARAALCDYLNSAVPLADLWVQFTAADARFAEVAARLGGGGARVLRQDPVECLFQFLCSSNNNIARIEKMVWTLAGYGERLGEVGGFVFHRFPTVERLAQVSEQELREAGFGYRAKYVVGTAKELMAKPGGGAKWLALLRDRELPEVATQYMLPELAGKSLTPKLSIVVADAFVAKFGEYAGWAQNVLFIGQLPAKKLVAAEVTSDTAKPTKRKRPTKMVEIQA
ncbi:hypothetical protein ACQJBY_021011 [Aegilops geniculata]